MKNCLERAAIICEGEIILPEHLPDCIVTIEQENHADTELIYTHQIEKYRIEYMRKIIIDALKKVNGNREETAKLLKISRKTLYNWMRELEINCGAKAMERIALAEYRRDAVTDLPKHCV